MEDITSETTEIDAKKPVKDIPVVQDEGLFQHDTGDTYDGFFEAKKKDRSLKMHGKTRYLSTSFNLRNCTYARSPIGRLPRTNHHYDGFCKTQTRVSNPLVHRSWLITPKLRPCEH